MALQFYSDPKVHAMYTAEVPMKRMGQPGEISSKSPIPPLSVSSAAGVVAFFASSAASYVTGQVLYVDGGFTVKGMGY